VKPQRILRAALGLALCVAGAAPGEEPPPDGAKLYQLNCQLCHGRDGKAMPVYAKKGAPDFNDAEWQKARTDEDIRNTITEGSLGTPMKAFKKTLSPEKIDALVKHIRTLKPPAS
jgi:cytochrome c oxidase cbb3-type subunit III